MNTIKNKAVEFLKWTEKYTKTDMLYLAKGGFWTTFSQIILSASTFLLAMAFAHFVSKETYGQYKYVLSIVSFLGTISLSGLATALLQSVSRGFEGSIRYAFWQNIKWSALFCLGAMGLSIYYFLNSNNFLGFSFLVAGCLWPLWASTNLYSPFLAAKKDFRRNSIYFDIIGNLFPYTCLFATMFFTDKPVWFVVVYFVSNTIIGLALYMQVMKIYKPNNDIDPEMISYGKHLSLITIIAGLIDNLDQILVFHYVGAAELAIYNFATAIPDQIKGPIKNLTNLIFPKFAERNDAEIKSGMKNKMLLLFLVTLAIILVYIPLTPFIYKIFFPKYTEAVLYSQIFSVSLLYVVAIPANAYLSVRKKVKEQYIINISTSVLQFFIFFYSIINHGLFGMILARVAVRFLSSSMTVLLYKKSIGN